MHVKAGPADTQAAELEGRWPDIQGKKQGRLGWRLSCPPNSNASLGGHKSYQHPHVQYLGDHAG